jgi:hypothetical protein
LRAQRNGADRETRTFGPLAIRIGMDSVAPPQGGA